MRLTLLGLVVLYIVIPSSGVWGWNHLNTDSFPETDLLSIVQDVRAADGYRYDAKDSAGNRMDTLKIIDNPEGGYLGVYHSPDSVDFTVHVATSNDLIHWQYQSDLSSHASQPTLVSLPEGSFLAAWEADNRPKLPWKSWVHIQSYKNLDDLLAGKGGRGFDAPHTLVPPDGGAEGTPNIYSVTLAPDLAHSIIDLGFHYYKDFTVDRQARGTLVNFSTWTTREEKELNLAIESHHIGGNIGGRDCLIFRGVRYNLIEGQYTFSDFGSWRTFIYDWRTGKDTELTIRTHGGTASFANPKWSLVKGPAGKPALVMTVYLPSQGSAPGEAGELVYYRNLDE